jgi:hypothetical protein
MPAINLYYSNFFGGLMGRPRKVSLGGGLGAASTVQPQRHLQQPQQYAHAWILMQPFARLASCLFGTLVELFESLQRSPGVVFPAWPQS